MAPYLRWFTTSSSSLISRVQLHLKNPGFSISELTWFLCQWCSPHALIYVSSVRPKFTSISMSTVHPFTHRSHCSFSKGWKYYFSISTIAPFVWQSFFEYYWHRIMHWPWFYLRFHKVQRHFDSSSQWKLHHLNRAPQPFDDLLIHPLEAFGYYCILFRSILPPFITTDAQSSVLYSNSFFESRLVRSCARFIWSNFLFLLLLPSLIIVGVMDHSGIKFEIPYLYNTVDHGSQVIRRFLISWLSSDKHHKSFNCNYSFPFPYFDILHGTYEGKYAGSNYSLISTPSPKVGDYGC